MCDIGRNILLTGTTGQLGAALLSAFSPFFSTIRLDRRTVDFRDGSALSAQLRKLDEIVLIINSAAYTAVDLAETHPETAKAVNAGAPGILAGEAERRNIPLLHFSTDYVFDGTLPPDEAYDESAPLRPVSVYGRTKLDGETAVRDRCSRHCILRLGWTYDRRGNNFLTRMLDLYRNGKTPRVVTDQYGSPTWIPPLVDILVEIVQKMIDPRDRFPWGLYHLAATDGCSRYEFAKTIFDRLCLPAPLCPIPVSTAEYPTPAPRPGNSRLQSRLFYETFGRRLPSWRDQLVRCLVSREE